MLAMAELVNSFGNSQATADRMDKARLFWDQQVRTRGRTGWFDPVVYAYDQQERVKLVKEAISRRPVKGGKALDFGCGPGDFSRLLLSLGFSVCGYDPFVKPKIPSRAFRYASSYDQISFRNHAASLALSITTLDHILDEDDLRLALTTIRDCLKDGAEFYMIEYALDSEDDRVRFSMKNDYQSFHTLSYWNQLLKQSALQILDIASVPHPFISPSSGYLPYLQSGVVRIIRRYPRFRSFRGWRDRLLRWQAARLLQASARAGHDGSSPLKLIRCSAV
jgi:SAM-dependent methyltransferase